MFKFLVLGVFLWHDVVRDVYAQTQRAVVDTKTPLLPTLTELKNNSNTGSILKTNGQYSFHASQQTFYVTNPFPVDSSTGLTGNFNEQGKNLPAGYLLTKGIGAHKVHLRKLTWNKARRMCIAEGGHLAIIRSDSEEKIVQHLMLENSVDTAFVGYHDMFEEGEWITVLDEPFEQTGWARWSKKFSPNPDNKGGAQNCAVFFKVGGGIDDTGCGSEAAFICKISLP